MERRNSRSWDHDLRAGRRTSRDVLEAYEARTEAAFEPGTVEHDERLQKARLWRAALMAQGVTLHVYNSPYLTAADLRMASQLIIETRRNRK